MTKIRAASILLAILTLTAGAVRAWADAALLMEEPYGEFGAMNPTGHAAVYFNHICAETPTMLRPCHEGEYGIVISRYHKIDGYDWLAIPLVGYLYAVDSPNDIPVIVDKAEVAEFRLSTQCALEGRRARRSTLGVGKGSGRQAWPIMKVHTPSSSAVRLTKTVSPVSLGCAQSL